MGKAKTDIAVIDHQIPRGSRLEKSELELAEAMIDQFEAFYRQGCTLDRIRVDEEYKDAQYGSFEEYMNKRMPLGIKKTQAYDLIKAKDVRPLLPDLYDKDSAQAETIPWTEKSIRPLTHKEFSKSDVRRLGRKIATRVKRGEKLTAPLVRSICDEDRGVERQQREKKAKALKETNTPAQQLREIKVEVDLWQSALEQFPEHFWTDAEAEDPGCVKRLIETLSALVSYLRS